LKGFDKDGQRQTQIENKRKKFKKPEILLSEFIKIKFSKTAFYDRNVQVQI
jgi:hypothetical protein